MYKCKINNIFLNKNLNVREQISFAKFQLHIICFAINSINLLVLKNIDFNRFEISVINYYYINV